jgi:hypothetical protein
MGVDGCECQNRAVALIADRGATAREVIPSEVDTHFVIFITLTRFLSHQHYCGGISASRTFSLAISCVTQRSLAVATEPRSGDKYLELASASRHDFDQSTGCACC